MNNYPLGSFPRFGHQERWAAQRRQRAIENSIATRSNQKKLRQKDEFRRIRLLLAVWSWLHDQINGRTSTPEVAQLAQLTAREVYRLVETWNFNRYYCKQLDALADATFRIADALRLRPELELCIRIADENVRSEFPSI
jgi:hypothetical protein